MLRRICLSAVEIQHAVLTQSVKCRLLQVHVDETMDMGRHRCSAVTSFSAVSCCSYFLHAYAKRLSHVKHHMNPMTTIDSIV